MPHICCIAYMCGIVYMWVALYMYVYGIVRNDMHESYI